MAFIGAFTLTIQFRFVLIITSDLYHVTSKYSTQLPTDGTLAHSFIYLFVAIGAKKLTVATFLRAH